jgi:hypothetical protein
MPSYGGMRAGRQERPPAGAGRARSRVLAPGAAAAAGGLVRRLREGAASGDYAALVAYLRGLAPSALDQQLRAMQARRAGLRVGPCARDAVRLCIYAAHAAYVHSAVCAWHGVAPDFPGTRALEPAQNPRSHPLHSMPCNPSTGVIDVDHHAALEAGTELVSTCACAEQL